MLAVRAVEGRAEVVEVGEPRGDGVTVHVRSVGICGSDLHLLPLLSGVPVTLGHEFAGVTDDGRPVAVEPLGACRRCDPCRAGHRNRCAGPPPLGLIGVSVDGGMAPRVRVPAEALVPLAAGVDPSVACLVEPLAVAVHGLRRLPLASGSMAVVGGGSIGLCAAAAARSLGTVPVVEARHEHQRAAADRLGATVFAEGDDLGGFDVVVEAAGTASALARAVDLCVPGGTVLVLGTYWGGVELPAMALCMKEVSLVPAAMYGGPDGHRDVDAAAAVLAADPAVAAALISHRFPLTSAPEAFATAAAKDTGAIKVVMEP